MNCKKCNNIIPNGITVCPNCGERVDTSSIIMPTESEPLPMPSDGINNSSIPEITPIKQMDSNTGTGKKSSNKSSIAIGVIGLIALAIIVFAIFKFIIPVLTDTESTSESDIVETIIGNNEYGYLSLTGNWNEYENEDGSTSLQYKNGEWIVSIESFENTGESVTAYDFAVAFLDNIKEKYSTVETNEVTKTTVAGYDAYKYSVQYVAENKWLHEWYFEVGDNKIYHISVEGPDETSDYYKIPDTFSLTEIE